MIRFVSMAMEDGEVAAMYQEGTDAVVMINELVTDPRARCEAVDRLLSRFSLLLPHLRKKEPRPTGKGVETLLI